MTWTKKDLLGLEELNKEEIELILATAESFKEVSTREIKKVPALRGKTAGLPRRAACGAGCSFGWMARRGNAAAGGNKAPGAQSGLPAGVAPGG